MIKQLIIIHWTSCSYLQEMRNNITTSCYFNFTNFNILNSQIAASASPSQRTILLSKSTSNAKQVLITFQDSDAISNYTKRGTDCFNANSFDNAYLQIGSDRFPVDPTQTYGEAYAYTLDAQGLLGSVLSAPVMDIENYQNASYSYGTADSKAQCFIWGANLERLRNEGVVLDGQNTALSAGGNMQYYIVSAPSADQTMVASIEFGAVVHIQANQVRVI